MCEPPYLQEAHEHVEGAAQLAARRLCEEEEHHDAQPVRRQAAVRLMMHITSEPVDLIQ